ALVAGPGRGRPALVDRIVAEPARNRRAVRCGRHALRAGLPHHRHAPALAPADHRMGPAVGRLQPAAAADRPRRDHAAVGDALRRGAQLPDDRDESGALRRARVATGAAGAGLAAWLPWRVAEPAALRADAAREADSYRHDRAAAAVVGTGVPAD